MLRALVLAAGAFLQAGVPLGSLVIFLELFNVFPIKDSFKVFVDFGELRLKVLHFFVSVVSIVHPSMAL